MSDDDYGEYEGYSEDEYQEYEGDEEEKEDEYYDEYADAFNNLTLEKKQSSTIGVLVGGKSVPYSSERKEAIFSDAIAMVSVIAKEHELPEDLIFKVAMDTDWDQTKMYQKIREDSSIYTMLDVDDLKNKKSILCMCCFTEVPTA